ncbi:MAG: DUF4271 domain-containing protein [Alistipes sp.]|jgi:hypothetical protein|nr:DUF4271 domain-containing protein [Alistipes sp.]
MIVQSVFFQILTLALVGAYCLAIYHFRGQMAVCLGSVAGLKAQESPDVENRQLYDRFLRMSTVLFHVVIVVGIVKLASAPFVEFWGFGDFGSAEGVGEFGEFGSAEGAGAFGGFGGIGNAGSTGNAGGIAASSAAESSSLIESLGAARSTWGAGSTGNAKSAGSAVAGEAAWWLPVVLSIFVAAIAAVVSAVRFGALKVAGWLTLSREFTHTLAGIRRIHVAAGAILLTPCALVFSGANPARDLTVAAIAATVVVALGVSLAIQSAVLFRKQKVSILVWFLYLCAVEIFPVGFALLLTIKNA